MTAITYRTPCGLLLLAALLAIACSALPFRPAPTSSPTVTATPLESGEVTYAPTATLRLTFTPSDVQSGPPSETPLPTSTRPPRTSAPPASDTPFPTTPTIVPGTLIRSLTASPQEINPGDAVTISWETVGDRASLCTIMPTSVFGTCEAVPLVGSRQFTTDPGVRNFVTYWLGAWRGDLLESATVTVLVRCPDTWFFPNPPGDCPATSALVTSGAAQRFERGLMIWLPPRDMIFVLFTDTSGSAYLMLTDNWQEGMPESDPAIVPPAGYYQPVRGFGLVWREPDGVIYNVRSRLGWATAPEFQFSTAYQCNSAPRYTTCYLQGPDGVIVLLPERSGWTIWTGPTPGP